MTQLSYVPVGQSKTQELNPALSGDMHHAKYQSLPLAFISL